jgi:hypothetical protein
MKVPMDMIRAMGCFFGVIRVRKAPMRGKQIRRGSCILYTVSPLRLVRLGRCFFKT